MHTTARRFLLVLFAIPVRTETQENASWRAEWITAPEAPERDEGVLGFLLHGETDIERPADTNATWDVEREKGIQTVLPQLRDEYYYVAEPGERLDGTKFDWTWIKVDPGQDTKRPGEQ